MNPPKMAPTGPEAAAWVDLTPETAEGLETAPTAPTAPVMAPAPKRWAPHEVERFTAPEFWAPGLVNGDWTGTEPAEREAAEAWAATLPGPIVSAEAAGFLWRHEAFAFWPFGACAALFSVLTHHKETEQ